MEIIKLVLGNEICNKPGNLKIVFGSGKHSINKQFALHTGGK
jgi:hypothetical protein